MYSLLQMDFMTKTLPAITSGATPQEILQAGLKAAGGPVKLACSFSVEDVVIIDLIKSLKLPVGIFAIDTGRLNEETYEVADALAEQYGLSIDWYFPQNQAVERLLQTKGPYSFRESLENRHECCQVRKVEPLSRALQGLGAWVTGLRREQSVTRADLVPIEIDSANGGILKINPLLDWTSAQVWDYATTHSVPVNRLHRTGYPSIGCAPCTRAIQPEEDERAGRWWWENPEHKRMRVTSEIR